MRVRAVLADFGGAFGDLGRFTVLVVSDLDGRVYDVRAPHSEQLASGRRVRAGRLRSGGGLLDRVFVLVAGLVHGAHHDGRFVLIAALNLPTFGPRLNLAPSETPDSGLLTVCAVPEADRRAFAEWLASPARRVDDWRIGRGQSVVLATSAAIHLDGEARAARAGSRASLGVSLDRGKHPPLTKPSGGDDMLGFGSIAKKVFGTANDRKVKSVSPIVDRINALEPEIQALSDAELAARTDEFRARLNHEIGDILVPIELREIDPDEASAPVHPALDPALNGDLPVGEDLDLGIGERPGHGRRTGKLAVGGSRPHRSRVCKPAQAPRVARRAGSRRERRCHVPAQEDSGNQLLFWLPFRLSQAQRHVGEDRRLGRCRRRISQRVTRRSHRTGDGCAGGVPELRRDCHRRGGLRTGGLCRRTR